MDYVISIENKGEYLHVKHAGADSYEISLELWQRIAKACEEHRCYSILGESDNSNVLSTKDAIGHIFIFRQVGITSRHRIAWVNHNPSAGPMFELIETVLKNRFVFDGHLFKDVEEARRWLLSKVDTPVR